MNDASDLVSRFRSTRPGEVAGIIPSDDAVAAAQLERDAKTREIALYAAVRMTQGDERFDAVDLIDLAEYIRSGARGLPIEAP